MVSLLNLFFERARSGIKEVEEEEWDKEKLKVRAMRMHLAEKSLRYVLAVITIGVFGVSLQMALALNGMPQYENLITALFGTSIGVLMLSWIYRLRWIQKAPVDKLEAQFMKSKGRPNVEWNSDEFKKAVAEIKQSKMGEELSVVINMSRAILLIGPYVVATMYIMSLSGSIGSWGSALTGAVLMVYVIGTLIKGEIKISKVSTYKDAYALIDEVSTNKLRFIVRGI
jgi:hypothetical protein